MFTITPLKEFGKNYPEFALKPKEALEKLLQEKNRQVAGAAYREDLGGIDFVWGTPKTKDSVGYGLAHIIERREQQALSDGLSEAEAKEYALNIVKSIPEVLEKGSKGTDHLGRMFVDYGNIRVGLNNTWNNKDLENHWVISSYELRDTTEKPTHFPTSQAITKEKDLHSLNSVGSNPTTNTQKTQDLSPLEQANAEKLLKLQHAITPLKEFGKNYPEFALKPKEALEKLLQEKNGQVAGAAFREDLGGIDFVWGTPKTKDSNGYGLAHILERRISNEMKKGLNEAEAKEYALNIIKSIPEVLEQGTRHAGAKKILVKHYGEESTGGLTNEELINISEVIKNGSVLLESFERLKNGFRYAYEWDNNGVKLRLVVDDLNDGNKIFDFYSDRNFKDFRDARPQPSTSKDSRTQPTTLNEPNPTQKPLIDQEDLLKTSENLNETTKEATNLSPLEQAEAEKLAKLESE
ncbi:DUF3519 domain-containing protein, partial [Helicobacter pylori]|uniref:DUF3519 domain-containing protein n=1 Tax=Helicobacter pylori TaxID=210 RepID=UPI003459B867